VLEKRGFFFQCDYRRISTFEAEISQTAGTAGLTFFYENERKEVSPKFKVPARHL
jgi:hypothetical protein